MSVCERIVRASWILESELEAASQDATWPKVSEPSDDKGLPMCMEEMESATSATSTKVSFSSKEDFVGVGIAEDWLLPMIVVSRREVTRRPAS